MSTKFIQLPTCKLAEFVSSSATSFDVSGFLYNDGTTAVDPTDIGDVCFATLEPKTVREELISFTIDSVTAAGVATLTVTRGLLQASPYTAGGATFDHQNGSDFVISNNPGLFDKLAAKANDETITGSWQFPAPSNVNNPATKTYTDTLAATKVGLTGDETIAGEKTFSTSPKIPDSGAADEAVTRGELDAEEVKLTGDQTIAGVKTFSSAPNVPTATADTEAINKAQAEAYVAANSGDIKASDSAYGTTKLDVAADTPSDPQALTATADRVAAVSGGGDFGIPSATNKFLTEVGVASSAFGFGDGSDGDVTISSPTTLTRDMYYNNLVVTSTLTTAGYRIFVKETLSGTGTIEGDGNDGASAGAGSASPGAGGTADSGYYKNVAGSAGTNGGSTGNNPSAAVAGTSKANVITGQSAGSASGTGGGGNGGESPTGASGGSATAALTRFGILLFQTIAALDITATGAMVKNEVGGGAAGGGGGMGYGLSGTGTSGAGGGGGASGNIVGIFVKNFTGTVTISSTGGNGGAGSDASSGNAGGGGGGAGGNGGYIYVVYASKTWTGSYVVTGGAGGARGADLGSVEITSAAGSAGSAGQSKEINITELL